MSLLTTAYRVRGCFSLKDSVTVSENLFTLYHFIITQERFSNKETADMGQFVIPTQVEILTVYRQ